MLSDPERSAAPELERAAIAAVETIESGLTNYLRLYETDLSELSFDPIVDFSFKDRGRAKVWRRLQHRDHIH